MSAINIICEGMTTLLFWFLGIFNYRRPYYNIVAYDYIGNDYFIIWSYKLNKRKLLMELIKWERCQIKIIMLIKIKPKKKRNNWNKFLIRPLDSVASNNMKRSFLTVVMILLVISATMPSCGWYNDWSRNQRKKDAETDGQAKLLEAESSKKVAVESAKANLESAKLNAQADSVRAQGIAKANKIIGQSLENNKAYLEWLWIDNIEKNQNAVYYVPTENKVPIFVNQSPVKKETEGNKEH